MIPTDSARAAPFRDATTESSTGAGGSPELGPGALLCSIPAGGGADPARHPLSHAAEMTVASRATKPACQFATSTIVEQTEQRPNNMHLSKPI